MTTFNEAFRWRSCFKSLGPEFLEKCAKEDPKLPFFRHGVIKAHLGPCQTPKS